MMSQPFKSIVSSSVFIRFHFFVFHEFDDFRYLFGLHFGDFWRSWEAILLISAVLEIY